MIEEDGTRRARYGDIKIRIPQDDVWRFASKLKRYLLQVVDGSLKDELANFG